MDLDQSGASCSELQEVKSRLMEDDHWRTQYFL